MRYDGHSCWLLPLLCQLQEDRDGLGTSQTMALTRTAKTCGIFPVSSMEGQRNSGLGVEEATTGGQSAK